MIVLMATGGTAIIDGSDLQRVPHALGQHRHRAARGAGRRHALPGPVRRGTPPLRDDVRPEHRRRDGAAALPQEVPGALTMAGTAAPTIPPALPPSPYGRLFRDGHPWVWVTRAFTALLLLLVLGIVGIVVVKGLATFWPARLSRFTLTDGRVLTGEEVLRQTGRDAEGGAVEEIQVRIAQPRPRRERRLRLRPDEPDREDGPARGSPRVRARGVRPRLRAREGRLRGWEGRRRGRQPRSRRCAPGWATRTAGARSGSASRRAPSTS